MWFHGDSASASASASPLPLPLTRMNAWETLAESSSAERRLDGTKGGAIRCAAMRCEAMRGARRVDASRVHCSGDARLAIRDDRRGAPPHSIICAPRPFARAIGGARAFVRSFAELISVAEALGRPIPSRPVPSVAACHRTASATARRLICGDGPFALIGSAHRFSSPFVSSPLVPSSRLGFSFTHFVVSVSFALRVASPSPLRCCTTRADPSRADPIQCDCDCEA